MARDLGLVRLMLATASSLLATAIADSPYPSAAVTSGSLRGIWELNGAVASFRGVPFAEAGRFEQPRAPGNWTGTRDASAFAPGCYQSGSNVGNPDVPAVMSEDCLFLNVFTPAAAHLGGGGALAPVMVWWHGGAFKEGSSFGPFELYNGAKMAAAGGVLVVSCAYSLGIYIRMYIRIYMHTHIHAYTYTCTHIHTQVPTGSARWAHSRCMTAVSTATSAS